MFWHNFEIFFVFPDRDFFLSIFPVFPVQWVPCNTMIPFQYSGRRSIEMCLTLRGMKMGNQENMPGECVWGTIPEIEQCIQ